MIKILISVIIALLLTGCGTDSEVFETTLPAETNDITTEITEVTENIEENLPDIKISEERAIEIASDHLNIKRGDVDEHSGFPYDLVICEKPTSESTYYEVALKWFVDNHHWSTVCKVYVDGITGECVN